MDFPGVAVFSGHRAFGELSIHASVHFRGMFAHIQTTFSTSSRLLLALVFLAVPAWSQEARVFTNKDGKTIEAELITVKGTQAEIRRATDGQVFNLEIINLCLEDQAWIADWLRNRSGIWKNLKVKFPGPMDTAGVIGISLSMSGERLSASEMDLLLPVGAWVELNVFCPDEHGEILEHLVRYDGASRWEITVEGRSLLLSRDGSPAQIYGLTLPERGSESAEGADSVKDFLDGLDQSRLADSLSVEVPSRFVSGELEDLGRPVVAVTRDGTFGGDALRLLKSWNPKALSISFGKGCLEALEEFDSLEALELRNDSYRMVNGVRESDYENREFSLPGVRDLGLVMIPFTPEINRSVASIKGLRLFEQSSPPQSASSGAPPASTTEWTGVDQFTSLESFSLPYDIRLSAREITSLPRLKSLAIGSRNFSNDDPDMENFANLTGLLQLAVLTTSFDDRIFDNWVKKGGLKDLRIYRGYHDRSFEGMPDLERLTLYRASDESRPMDSDVFADLPNLCYLSLTSLGEQELEILKSLSAPDRLEAIRLQGGTFDSIDPLQGFPNLRRLEVTGWERCPETLDFGTFPALELLVLSRVPNLREVRDLASHPSLLSLRFYGCDSLQSTGQAFENTTLRNLSLYDCGGLTDLTGFSGCTGLTHIYLYNCDAISEPMEIDRLNPRAYISVSGCEELRDRRPGGPLP